MRLCYVWIENYKHLKNFTLDFSQQKDFESSTLSFLIGHNGSGKSAMLEAIGLIFSRVMQDEVPGFKFSLKYLISNNNKQQLIEIRPNHKGGTNRLKVIVDSVQLDAPFSQHPELHPSHIFFCGSGPNNTFEDVIWTSATESLVSDIYDASEGVQTPKEYNVRTMEIKDSLSKIRNSLYDPRFLNLDNSLLKFVIVSLCAIVPNSKSRRPMYIKLRQSLLDVNGPLTPISFSLILDENRLKEVMSSKERLIGLRPFLQLVLHQQELAVLDQQKTLYDWAVSVNSRDSRERVVAFNYRRGDYAYVPALTNIFNPVEFFSTLVVAKREGLLKDIHFAFKHRDIPDVLSESALSDGEYLWISKLGAILLAQGSGDSNTLFVYDEPDVHLNESWVVNFVSTINHLDFQKNLGHQFIVATHSSLILTDSTREQLHRFVRKGTVTVPGTPIISPFGANRAEISRHMFGTKESIGTFSSNMLSHVINNRDTEEIERYLDIVGPGAFRLKLRNLLMDLETDDYSEE